MQTFMTKGYFIYYHHLIYVALIHGYPQTVHLFTKLSLAHGYYGLLFKKTIKFKNKTKKVRIVVATKLRR